MAKAGRAAQAIARAKLLAQEAVNADAAGRQDEAIVGYRKTLENIEKSLEQSDAEGVDKEELRKFAQAYQDRIGKLTGHRPELNVSTPSLAKVASALAAKLAIATQPIAQTSGETVQTCGM